MASDFYRKTKELFEEFQKRELHYLNMEQVFSSRFQIRNDSSLPIQDYLQKLNKSEKENEETYKGLMNQIQELDYCTERISEKLERLSVLRYPMVSKFSSQSSAGISFDKPFLNRSNPPSTLQTMHDFKHTISNSTQPISFQNKETRLVSTQTDHIFCENCHFPLLLSEISKKMSVVPPSLESIHPPLQNSLDSTSYSKASLVASERHLEPSNFEIQNDSSIKLNNNNNDDDGLSNISSIVRNPSKENPPNTTAPLNSTFIYQGIENISTREKDTILTATNENAIMKENHQLLEDITSATDNIDRIVSKSDDESLNHEFDFLESDKTNKQKLHFQEPSPFSASEGIGDVIVSNEAFVMEESESHVSNEIPHTHDADMHNLEISPSLKNVTQSNSNSTQDNGDRISESSVSLGGERSPSLRSDNMSAVSDTDSLYEKEEPQLKATAAYQALLGNVSAAKNKQQSFPYSESESEDEVERALANATRKSISSLTSPIKVEKIQETKKSIPETKAKIETRKSISVTKPVLSKSTRKALGLSSGSEGEVQIQDKTSKKIEEDSDEFDFYD